MLPIAYQRYNQKRKELNFKTDTNIYIHLVEDKIMKISTKNYSIIDKKDFKDTQYVTYKIHPKLLYRILKGPRYAHWNNAEIGSHIEFTRYPEIYERKLYYLTNFLHV